MDLSLDRPGDHNYISALGEQGIRVGEDYYSSALLLSADYLQCDWPLASIDEISQGHLDEIFALEPELVLVGTGREQVFLQPRRMMQFFERGVGIEVMATDAACRTFNLLVSDGRKVVAVLLPV